MSQMLLICCSSSSYMTSCWMIAHWLPRNSNRWAVRLAPRAPRRRVTVATHQNSFNVLAHLSDSKSRVCRLHGRPARQSPSNRGLIRACELAANRPSSRGLIRVFELAPNRQTGRDPRYLDPEWLDHPSDVHRGRLAIHRRTRGDDHLAERAVWGLGAAPAHEL